MNPRRDHSIAERTSLLARIGAVASHLTRLVADKWCCKKHPGAKGFAAACVVPIAQFLNEQIHAHRQPERG